MRGKWKWHLQMQAILFFAYCAKQTHYNLQMEIKQLLSHLVHRS